MASRLGLHELDIESNGDLVSNENSASLEGSVPGQAEVLSVDLCDRRDRNSGVAPGILRRRSRPFNRKADLADNAVDGEVAFDGQLSVPDDADAPGFEVQGRKPLHVKEIGALKVSIALVIARWFRIHGG